MTQPHTNKSVAAAKVLHDADARRKRAVNHAVLATFVVWAAAFGVYAMLKAIQGRSILIEIALLVWNAVMIAVPLVGFVVYRRMR
ncbi:MAG TPA: hypothetical protein VMM18_17280 [Gemmatimonadaceae bacterium]|nr:hypothetical protein [Gemmatimonadaceae bacterium]